MTGVHRNTLFCCSFSTAQTPKTRQSVQPLQLRRTLTYISIILSSSAPPAIFVLRAAALGFTYNFKSVHGKKTSSSQNTKASFRHLGGLDCCRHRRRCTDQPDSARSNVRGFCNRHGRDHSISQPDHCVVKTAERAAATGE